MVGITNSVNLNSSGGGGGRLVTHQITCICTKAANATTITMDVQVDGTSVFSDDTIICDIYGEFAEKTGSFTVDSKSFVVNYYGTKSMSSTTPFLFIEFNYDSATCRVAPEIISYTANGSNSSYAIVNTTQTAEMFLVTGESGGIPTGSSVLPVNDAVTWIKCAGVTSSVTTLSGILADTSLLNSLIASDNASDYLVRCIGFIDVVSESSDAVTAIAGNDYCANLLLSSADWANALFLSTYSSVIYTANIPKMTSNNAPSGNVLYSTQYSATYTGFKAMDRTDSTYWNSTVTVVNRDEFIGYDFGKSVVINRVSIKTHSDGSNYAFPSAVLQGSNDGTNWTNVKVMSFDASDSAQVGYNKNTTNAYSQWRLIDKDVSTAGMYVIVIELQFSGREIVGS